MFKNKLTLDWIETTLKIDGFNAKEKVCNRLHYANEKELISYVEV